MALVYFDASAFVKLLTIEPGSELAVALWDGCDAALSSRIAAIADPELIIAVWDLRLHSGAQSAGCRLAPAQLG